MRERYGTLEVVDFEDRGAGFRGSTLKFRAVDFHEPLRGKEFSEEVSDRSLDPENRVIRLCP